MIVNAILWFQIALVSPAAPPPPPHSARQRKLSWVPCNRSNGDRGLQCGMDMPGRRPLNNAVMDDTLVYGDPLGYYTRGVHVGATMALPFLKFVDLAYCLHLVVPRVCPTMMWVDDTIVILAHGNN